MSWTIYASDDGENSESLKDLVATLGTAASRPILLYCAGQDQGEYEETRGRGKPYPASGELRIKRVGSARAYGGVSEFVNPSNVDYLFPGEIEAVAGVTTGSSAATALASGLAALIMWCAEAYRAEILERNKVISNKPKDAREETTVPEILEDLDFQQSNRMADLFDELKTVRDSSKASLVNITGLLKDAKNSQGKHAETLVKLCRDKIPQSFPKSAPAGS